jgi:hypothetical protein
MKLGEMMKKAGCAFWMWGCLAVLTAADAAPAGRLTGALNAELPRWLRLSGEERVRLEAPEGIGFAAAGNRYLLERLRLGFDFTPASWLRFTVQAQDSRVFFSNVHPAPASQRNPAELRLAFLQLGDPETGHFSLRAGRQALAFGEGRLMADPNWSNVGRTFDAVRLTARYGGARLDVFSGASDKSNATGFDRPVPGQRVYGMYASVDRLVPKAVVEPYFIRRVERDFKMETGRAARLRQDTVGIRWAGQVRRRTDYGVELASEFGTVGGEPVRAWAGHLVLGYVVADTLRRPRLFLEFNRASGDQNPRDGVHGTFDPLFPSSHDKLGLADQFTWTNIAHARSGLQYKARKNLSLSAAYNSFWLANRRDGIYSSGKVSIASTGGRANHIGQEADVQAQWNVSRTATLDTGYGYLFPGSFLHAAHRSTRYHILFLGLAQRF